MKNVKQEIHGISTNLLIQYVTLKELLDLSTKSKSVTANQKRLLDEAYKHHPIKRYLEYFSNTELKEPSQEAIIYLLKDLLIEVQEEELFKAGIVRKD
ncbi:MAG: hypothetical protein GWN01_09455 [Nitrosopumilaceae archaeon]|nr:hypothetical protein [Nitrosopumilaceae archaeon]NIU87835.1 hypothetical protein [Nitrosopumilaceae archaeon]NIV65217.1 hypothetical protein [Nitrosopumilaceae archaeon]NIX61733.1 hypothetical protein [Nitrosopumilaceae archaeon]